MSTIREQQAVSAILHKANRHPSKSLFLKECLEVLIDLFDCTVVAVWLSSEELYRFVRVGPPSTPDTRVEDESSEGFSAQIRAAKYSFGDLVSRLHSGSLPPSSVLSYRNGIYWTNEIEKVLSEHQYSEAGFSDLADIAGKSRSSLMVTSLDTGVGGLGTLLISSDRSDHLCFWATPKKPHRRS